MQAIRDGSNSELRQIVILSFGRPFERKVNLNIAPRIFDTATEECVLGILDEKTRSPHHRNSSHFHRSRLLTPHFLPKLVDPRYIIAPPDARHFTGHDWP
ncbi:uncharacterized protein TrAFT101_002654 [Trichoderma asperellum]|uniref:uncharacterized protein n=1 Tax=Trichoderma asperellum TaxID=101201 RepID=UPI003332C072|nr:hypothetical protein TrAFT101_002654 [Trichoderma asperellum]